MKIKILFVLLFIISTVSATVYNRYIDTDSTASSGPGTSSDYSSPYNHIQQAITATKATPGAGDSIIYHFRGSIADSQLIDIDGFNNDAIIIIDVDIAYRHSGMWDNTKPRLVKATGSMVYLREGNIHINGLQIGNTALTGTTILLQFVSNPANSDIRISNCIMAGPYSADQIWYPWSGTWAARKMKIWNCIVYGFSDLTNYLDITNSTDTVMIYSTTIITNETVNFGIRREAGMLTMKNCYVSGGSNSAYFGKVAGGFEITTCASDDATGSTGYTSWAVNTSNFVNVTQGTEDFTLPSGSVLIDTGTTTTGDTDPLNFSTDIVGTSRPVGTKWDIGAFEFDVGCTPPTITYSKNPDTARVNIAFSQSATLGGGTTDSVTATGLPTNLSVNSSTGNITGTIDTLFATVAVEVIAWGCSNDTVFDTLVAGFPPVAVDSVVPDSGVVGSVAAVYGEAFGFTQGGSTVLMGDSAVTVTNWDNTLLNIIIPDVDTGTYDFIISDGVISDTLLNAYKVIVVDTIELDSIQATKKTLKFYTTSNLDSIIVICSTFSELYSIDTFTTDTFTVSGLCYGTLVNYTLTNMRGTVDTSDTVSTLDRYNSINSYRRIGRPDTIQVALFLMASKQDSCESFFKTGTLTGTSISAYSYTGVDTTVLTITTDPFKSAFGSLWYLKLPKTDYNTTPADTLMEFIIEANEIEPSSLTRIIHGE